MAPKYDDGELTKALDKIDAHLAKSEGTSEESNADLVKSLADVAKGAIGLAEEKQSKRQAKADRLAKAAAAKEKDDDDKDDDDDAKDDMPAWLKDVVHDGKAAGETILAPGREATGTHQGTNAGDESRSMSKAVSLAGVDVVDVEGYLQSQLAQQAEMAKALKKANKLNKAMLQGLLSQDARLQELEAFNQQQARFTATCAKALGAILAQREAYLDTPLPSKFTAMEKSIQVAQHQIDAAGGTVFDPAANKELLSKAIMTGKITTEQATLIKRTKRLPAGITLN